MQVTNNIPFTQLKTVSTPSVPPIDRSPVPASANSSSNQYLASDLVTFSTKLPVSESSDLVRPVNQAGNSPDVSADTNQVTEGDREEEIVENEFRRESFSQDDDADDERQNENEARDDVEIADTDRDENPERNDSEQNNVERAARESADNDEPEAGLSSQEREQVAELSARDAEVKAHERAHQAVGGQFAGSIAFNYQQGPDGKRYAIGGEVPIDVAPINGDPQATIDKMRQVKAAALAPNEPSPQDRSVATTAARLLVEAQIELAEQKRQESIEAREEASAQSQQTNEAVRTYETLIGLGKENVDPKDLIDELI